MLNICVCIYRTLSWVVSPSTSRNSNQELPDEEIHKLWKAIGSQHLVKRTSEIQTVFVGYSFGILWLFVLPRKIQVFLSCKICFHQIWQMWILVNRQQYLRKRNDVLRSCLWTWPLYFSLAVSKLRQQWWIQNPIDRRWLGDLGLTCLRWFADSPLMVNPALAQLYPL